VNIQKLHPDHEADQKKTVLEGMGNNITATIGNGANDVKMLERACLGIVVLGREGFCADALAASDICVANACIGLDLLLFPKRIVATLRR
jgi:soluble P-type ATPase